MNTTVAPPQVIKAEIKLLTNRHCTTIIRAKLTMMMMIIVIIIIITMTHLCSACIWYSYLLWFTRAKGTYTLVSKYWMNFDEILVRQCDLVRIKTFFKQIKLVYSVEWKTALECIKRICVLLLKTPFHSCLSLVGAQAFWLQVYSAIFQATFRQTLRFIWVASTLC